MRALFSIGGIALMTAFAVPASAQMCGGGQTQAGTASMCGGMAASTAAPAMGEQQSSSMKPGCSCCQNMAMMQAPAEEDTGDAPMMDMPEEEAPETPPQ